MEALNNYTPYLSSDDLFDPEIIFRKQRAKGGSMVMVNKSIDSFVTLLPPPSSAITPILLQIPGLQTSVHISLYLPTSSQEHEFISQISNLRHLIENVIDTYDNPLVFIRGDGNANINNISRHQLLHNLLSDFGMKTVDIPHKTYHHFVGNGQYDSNIDILAFTVAQGVPGEVLGRIICKYDTPGIRYHNDLILSSFYLPAIPLPQKTYGLVKAPRISVSRCKIRWTDDGILKYNTILTELLPQLNERWAIPESESAVAILLQCTTAIAYTRFLNAQKAYHAQKRNQDTKRDKRLFEILSNNPMNVYQFIRRSKRNNTSWINHLKVGNKVYTGDDVADGFYDSLTTLKTTLKS